MNIDLETGELDLSEIRYIAPTVDVPKTKMVEPGTLLICTASGSKKHLGKTAHIDQPIDFAFGGFMGLLVPSKLIMPKYLHWLMRSDAYWEFIDQLSSGTNINNLKFSQLGAFPIPLPPLDEQKRIVAVLDEAFEGLSRARANAEANLADARKLLGSSLTDAFGATRWPIKFLHEISENLDRLRVPITKGDRIVGNVPYYGASGVVDYVEGFLFDEGLLLVSEDGANLLARTYPIAFSIYGKSWVNNHAHVLRFPDLETQEFVRLYLNSISLEPYVSGMAQPKLNQAQLNRIPIPFPSAKERSDLVIKAQAISSEISALEALYLAEAKDLEALRQSLLQEAFSGKLTAAKQVVSTGNADLDAVLDDLFSDDAADVAPTHDPDAARRAKRISEILSDEWNGE